MNEYNQLDHDHSLNEFDQSNEFNIVEQQHEEKQKNDDHHRLKTIMQMMIASLAAVFVVAVAATKQTITIQDIDVDTHAMTVSIDHYESGYELHVYAYNDQHIISITSEVVTVSPLYRNQWYQVAIETLDGETVEQTEIKTLTQQTPSVDTITSFTYQSDRDLEIVTVTLTWFNDQIPSNVTYQLTDASKVTYVTQLVTTNHITIDMTNLETFHIYDLHVYDDNQQCIKTYKIYY